MADLYGRGIAFPFELEAGGVAETTGVDKVEQSMLVILTTQPGERLMRPDFGSQLGALTFAPNNGTTADLARFYVIDALARWEPRVEVLDVVAGNTVGLDGSKQLRIDITYRLKATQDVRTLVHPFPLEPTS